MLKGLIISYKKFVKNLKFGYEYASNPVPAVLTIHTLYLTNALFSTIYTVYLSKLLPLTIRTVLLTFQTAYKVVVPLEVTVILPPG